jgi:hypothetical protein
VTAYSVGVVFHGYAPKIPSNVIMDHIDRALRDDAS